LGQIIKDSFVKSLQKEEIDYEAKGTIQQNAIDRQISTISNKDSTEKEIASAEKRLKSFATEDITKQIKELINVGSDEEKKEALISEIKKKTNYEAIVKESNALNNAKTNNVNNAEQNKEKAEANNKISNIDNVVSEKAKSIFNFSETSSSKNNETENNLDSSKTKSPANRVFNASLVPQKLRQDIKDSPISPINNVINSAPQQNQRNNVSNTDSQQNRNNRVFDNSSYALDQNASNVSEGNKLTNIKNNSLEQILMANKSQIDTQGAQLTSKDMDTLINSLQQAGTAIREASENMKSKTEQSPEVDTLYPLNFQ